MGESLLRATQLRLGRTRIQAEGRRPDARGGRGLHVGGGLARQAEEGLPEPGQQPDAMAGACHLSRLGPKDNPDDAELALDAIWSDGEPDQRIAAFLAALPPSFLGGRGTRLAIASYLLMAAAPTDWPVYRPTPFEKAFQLTGTKPPPGADGRRRPVCARARVP